MQPLVSGFILRIERRTNSSWRSVPPPGPAGEGYPRPTVLAFKIHKSFTTALFADGPAPGHMEATLQFVSRNPQSNVFPTADDSQTHSSDLLSSLVLFSGTEPFRLEASSQAG